MDASFHTIPGTERVVACDTLLLSIGLIPENELAKRAGVELSPLTSGAIVDESLMTSVPGIFSCGNVLHIHDVADWASFEGFAAGKAAAEFAAGRSISAEKIRLAPGPNVRYCLPQTVRLGTPSFELSFRVSLQSGWIDVGVETRKALLSEIRLVPRASGSRSTRCGGHGGLLSAEHLTCILCPLGCALGSNVRAVSRREPVRQEWVCRWCPPSMQRIDFSPPPRTAFLMVSVRLSGPVPRAMIFPVLAEIAGLRPEPPVLRGQVLIPNVLGTGVDVIATRTVKGDAR
jgi:CxxC motif-containing protein